MLLAAASSSSTSSAVLQNDAVIAGLLLAMLGAVFWTHQLDHPGWKRFYRYIPMLLLCYFLPSLLTSFGLVDPHQSKLYFVASRYMLPTSLVLLTLGIDLKEIKRLGPKALIMFITGTVGVVVGGPIAVWLTAQFDPGLVQGQGSEALWRGLSTVAGSWIGGGANQAAMKEIFQPSNALYSVMVAVDVVVAELWMVLLLIGVERAPAIDRWMGADASSIHRLRDKMADFSKRSAKVPSSAETMALLGLGFGATALAHFLADRLAPWIKSTAPQLSRFSLDSTFFWLIVLATTFGLLLSMTKARKLEGVGASRLGTVAIFFLIATIGLNMDIRAVAEHPRLFLVGGVWMLIHVLLLALVGYLTKAPYFFWAVGSKANIGGAASAPVVAAAFHPALAPVGVLLAVLGYALGTYGAWLSAITMQALST